MLVCLISIFIESKRQLSSQEKYTEFRNGIPLFYYKLSVFLLLCKAGLPVGKINERSPQFDLCS